MPVYNTARYVEDGITSVLGQSFQSLELVVVDDASTDGSSEVIHRLSRADPRVRVLQHQTNKGFGAALAAAYAAARGEYVVIMDSDDVMLPERVALQVQWLQRNRSWAAVGSQWLYVDEHGKAIHVDCHAADPTVVRTVTFAYQAIHNPTVCLRRSALRAEHQFAAGSRITADAAFYAQLAVDGLPFASMPQVLHQWRRNPTGTTHGRAREQTEVADRARQAAFESLRHRDRAEAAKVAREILEAFPAGTWFEERARQVGVKTSRDYLLAALPPPGDAFERLKRTAIEWFEHPAAASVALEGQLRASGASLYADLLALHDGRGTVSGRFGLTNDDPAQGWHREGEALAVFVEFDGDADDLRARIASLLACPVVDHVAVYASSSAAARGIAVPQVAGRVGCMLTCHDSLYDALAACKAGLWCHLPSRHRFDESVLAAAVQALRTGRDRVCYSPLRFVYPFARIAGAPGIEPNPTTSTQPGDLLAQERLSLGSFVYRPGVLARFPLPMAELGTTGLQEGLLSYLFHLDGSTFVAGHHDYLQDDLRLSDRVLAHLHAHLVRSYFDGAGVLPAAGGLDAMGPRALETALAACDAAWRKGCFRIHRGNIGRILSALAKCPHQAWSTQLGRYVWRGRYADLADAFRAEGHLRHASVAKPVNLLLRVAEKLTS